MIGHDEARERASARFDGELPPGLDAGLDAHLAGCAECSAYAGQLAALRTLAAALPAEAPPAGWAGRVDAAVAREGAGRGGVVARRRVRWWAPAAAVVAVAAGLVLVASLLPPSGALFFDLPPAAAAEPLLRLRSLYVEREVVEENPGEPTVRREQRIWFRAPGDSRVEERRTTNGVVVTSLEISRPGVRYTREGDTDTLYTGVPPSASLPEPLSVAVATLGTDRGPGPVVAGRPTRRYELTVGGERRDALVDAARPADLGSVDQVVLMKGGSAAGRRVVKTATVVRYDEPMADTLFAPPASAGTTVDLGFVPRPAAGIVGAPEANLAGFRLLASGERLGVGYLLYARGALRVLVAPGLVVDEPEGPSESRRSNVHGRPATLTTSLYGAPRLRFAAGGRVVVVSAPVPASTLVGLAENFYPEPE